MKKTLLSAVAVLALLAPHSARAQEAQEQKAPQIKPMLVVSVRSYKQLIVDLNTLGEISDMPGLGLALNQLINQFTQGQGIPGLDKDKPLGLAVSANGFEFQVLGFLPIKKLDDFMELVGQFSSDVEKQDDGTYEVSLGDLPLPIPVETLYFKQHGDWTYVSILPSLNNLPDDPSALLDDLDEQYHVAARIYFSNIPELFRQMAVQQLKTGVEQGLAGNIPGGPKVKAEVEVEAEKGKVEVEAEVEVERSSNTAEMARRQVEAISSLLNDTAELTIGWKLDASTKRGLIDLVMVQTDEAAKRGGGLLSQVSEEVTTEFSGFVQEKATIAANVSLPLGDAEIAQFKQSLDELEEHLLDRISGISQLGEESQDLVEDFFDEIFEAAEETVDSGKVDLGFSVMGKGPFTIFGGVYVKDGNRINQLLERFVSLVEDELGFFGIDRSTIEKPRVKLYSTWVPIPGGETGDQLAELFGDNLELVFGTGEHAFYLGLGEGSIELVKGAIEASALAADKKTTPVQATVAVGPLLKLLASSLEKTETGEDRPLLSMMNLDLEEISENLEEGKDRVFVTVKPVRNGVHTHIELEEGLIKTLGSLLMTLGTAGVPGLNGGF